MKRLTLIFALCVAGCASASPERMTLGVQVDADSGEIRTYTAQLHWSLRAATR